ncbi:hypothetical protein D3C73_1215990 [compost metagenome]
MLPIPNWLLKFAPSNVKLFDLKLPPPIFAPLACGVKRVKSFTLRVMEGKFSIWRRPTIVDAPFFSLFKVAPRVTKTSSRLVAALFPKTGFKTKGSPNCKYTSS